MARRQSKDHRLVWKKLLEWACSEDAPDQFTAFDGVELYPPPARGAQDERPTKVAQVLNRLRGWGYVRLVGFQNPQGGGGKGRRRHLYEVTEKAVNRFA